MSEHEHREIVRAALKFIVLRRREIFKTLNQTEMREIAAATSVLNEIDGTTLLIHICFAAPMVSSELVSSMLKDPWQSDPTSESD